MEYEIKILKVDNEGNQRDEILGMARMKQRPIFNAVMNADHAIEILQHLYDLNEKERQEAKKSE